MIEEEISIQDGDTIRRFVARTMASGGQRVIGIYELFGQKEQLIMILPARIMHTISVLLYGISENYDAPLTPEEIATNRTFRRGDLVLWSARGDIRPGRFINGSYFVWKDQPLEADIWEIAPYAGGGVHRARAKDLTVIGHRADIYD